MDKSLPVTSQKQLHSRRRRMRQGVVPVAGLEALGGKGKGGGGGGGSCWGRRTSPNMGSILTAHDKIHFITRHACSPHECALPQITHPHQVTVSQKTTVRLELAQNGAGSGSGTGMA